MARAIAPADGVARATRAQAIGMGRGVVEETEDELVVLNWDLGTTTWRKVRGLYELTKEASDG